MAQLHKDELVSLFETRTQFLSSKVKTQILPKTGTPSNPHASRDYIRANALLSEYFKFTKQTPKDLSSITDSKELWDVLPLPTRFRLAYYTPCLCAQYDSLKPAEQKALFESSDWLATEKENGIRGWLFLHEGKVSLFSRNYSSVDCSLLEYSDNMWFPKASEFPKDVTLCLDVEIKWEPGVDVAPIMDELGITTDSPLEAIGGLLQTYPEEALKIQQKFYNIYHTPVLAYRVIHPLIYKNKNYINLPLGVGQDVYDEVIDYAQSIGLLVKPIPRCRGNAAEKEAFLNTCLETGEGLVFHNRLGNYCTSEKRSKTSFVKLKRSVSSAHTKVSDTLDAFVVDYTMKNDPVVGPVIVSYDLAIFVDREDGTQYQKTIARVTNIPRDIRVQTTKKGADGVLPREFEGEVYSLNPAFYHMVYEVDGQAFSSRSGRLEHAKVLRPRTERDYRSCIYTQSFIDANTTKSFRNNGQISYTKGV